MPCFEWPFFYNEKACTGTPLLGNIYTADSENPISQSELSKDNSQCIACVGDMIVKAQLLALGYTMFPGTLHQNVGTTDPSFGFCTTRFLFKSFLLLRLAIRK